MAIADRGGMPLAVLVASASPHETRLVKATLAARSCQGQAGVFDWGSGSDPLDKALAQQGIEMIAPHGRRMGVSFVARDAAGKWSGCLHAWGIFAGLPCVGSATRETTWVLCCSGASRSS